jgi:hypothetical protein
MTSSNRWRKRSGGVRGKRASVSASKPRGIGGGKGSDDDGCSVSDDNAVDSDVPRARSQLPMREKIRTATP